MERPSVLDDVMTEYVIGTTCLLPLRRHVFMCLCVRLSDSPLICRRPEESISDDTSSRPPAARTVSLADVMTSSSRASSSHDPPVGWQYLKPLILPSAAWFGILTGGNWALRKVLQQLRLV